jgi:hypothetical protein
MKYERKTALGIIAASELTVPTIKCTCKSVKESLTSLRSRTCGCDPNHSWYLGPKRFQLPRLIYMLV